MSTNKEEFILRIYIYKYGKYKTQNSTYTRDIQYSGRPSVQIGQAPQHGMVLGSNDGQLYISDAQFSQCWFVCESIHSQTPIICLTSYGQSSICDRCTIHELERSSCLCFSISSSDTAYSDQNSSILMQNSINCSSLATVSLVLRGFTTSSISPNLTSIL